jgi:hypothetical protein
MRGAVVALVLFGCHEPPSPARLPPVASVAPPRRTPRAPSAEPVPPTPSSEPATTESAIRIDAEMSASGARCTFAFTGALVNDTPDFKAIASITHIAVEESTTCAAATLYDLEEARKVDPSADEGGLAGGIWPLPGKHPDVDSPFGIETHDMNFDGFADLTVISLTGMFSYSHLDWIYDPATRTFTRDQALEDLSWPRFDTATKTVHAGGRVTGPVYEKSEHAWINGKLETTESVVTYLGESPTHQPLPAGYAYEVRHKRVKGALVKVHDGPVKQ